MVFNVGANDANELIYYGTMLDDIDHTSQSEAEIGTCSINISESESEEVEKKRPRPKSDIFENEQPKKQIKNEIDELTGDLSLKVSLTKKGVVRLDDMCNVHVVYPQIPCIEGSGNVVVNGKPVHRQGDRWLEHPSTTNPELPIHNNVILVHGSNSVFVNGKAIARTGDLISCGAKAEQGSNDVFAG